MFYLSHSCCTWFRLSVFVMCDSASQKCKVSKSRFCFVYWRTSYCKHTVCFDSAHNSMRVNTVVDRTTPCCVTVSFRTSSYDRPFFFAVTQLLQNLIHQKSVQRLKIQYYISSVKMAINRQEFFPNYCTGISLYNIYLNVIYICTKKCTYIYVLQY